MKHFSVSAFQLFSIYLLVGKNLGECPALELGNRFGLDDADAVTNGGFRFLVVHVVFLRAFDDLVELRVGNTCDVLDDDGLFHFIGNDNADAGLALVLDGRCGFLG